MQSNKLFPITSAVAEGTHDVKEIYDSIAEQYVELKQIPYRTAVEQYTLFNCMLLKNETNLGKNARILDIACGDGHYTRKIRKLFPECAYICGVDISSTMINLARTCENENKLGIHYACVDGRNLPLPEQPYDIVTAIFYLNYAQTRDDLRAMIKGIYDQLKQGGTCYFINDNICTEMEGFNKPMHEKYNFRRELTEPTLREGAPIKYTLFRNTDTTSSCVFYNYFFFSSTYEELFKECAFSSFRWVPVQCDPDIDNVDFFDDLISLPHIIGMIAKK